MPRSFQIYRNCGTVEAEREVKMYYEILALASALGKFKQIPSDLVDFSTTGVCR